MAIQYMHTPWGIQEVDDSVVPATEVPADEPAAEVTVEEPSNEATGPQ